MHRFTIQKQKTPTQYLCIMKALGKKLILVCICVFAGFISSYAQEASPFVYDIKYDGNKVISKTIFIQEDGSTSLKKCSHYEFAYDASGRMIEKISYKWNNEKKEWDNKTKMEFVYNNNETITVNLAFWDTKHKSYSLNPITQTMNAEQMEQQIAKS